MIDLLRKRLQQVSATNQASLTLWSERFFADKIGKLVQAISADA